MHRNLAVNPERIEHDIAQLATITEPDRPWTRRSFTPMFLRGRRYIEDRMREAGLETRIDAAGNLLGVRRGKASARAIMLGSHSDTVPDGGRFDGIAGVIAGLEVARALRDGDIELDHDLIVVDFLAEEVSAFGVSCVGSRGLTGQFPEAWLEREEGGRTLAEALEEVGGDAEAIRGLSMPDIKGFLELHIEQGPVLEREKTDIGIVGAISGITRIELTFHGQPGHAGTTPMGARADALVAASRFVTRLDDAARLLASQNRHFAATVGEFRMEPNAANVVPAKVRLLIDARAEHRPDMDTFLTWLRREATRIDGAEGVAVPAPVIISDNPAVPSDSALLELLRDACGRIGASHRPLASGAGHDAAWMARKAPAAMIFVPSRDGLSHAPEEWTENDAIALGAEVLFEAVIALDKLAD
jgi:N-carbamoyl-L-amino-acid hydrolase